MDGNKKIVRDFEMISKTARHLASIAGDLSVYYSYQYIDKAIRNDLAEPHVKHDEFRLAFLAVIRVMGEYI